MSSAAARFVASGLSASEWARFKEEDPKGAVRWAAGMAQSLGASIDWVAKLRVLSDTDAFDPATATPVLAFVEERLALGQGQAARAATLQWSAEQRPDAPAFTGRVEMQGERVVFTSNGATYGLHNSGDQCWGTDATAFYGQVVTIKG